MSHSHDEHDHDHDDHDHSHGHDHGGHGHSHGGHGHSHAPADFGRAFLIGITLNTAFVVVEVVYGLMAHSLALVADAGHNLSDVLGLLLAWGAALMAKRAPTARHTYGLRRSTVLAALFNAIFLLVSVGAIAWEALRRLGHPEPIVAGTVIWVALLGIVINGITAMMFMSGSKDDLNIRGAFAHMAADAIISAGVVVAGIVIVYTGWEWLDPVVSLALVAVIVAGTWGLLRDSVDLSLDAVPAGINPEAVQQWLLTLPAVKGAHHLHIWGLSTTESALTVHLVIEEGQRSDALLHDINDGLREKFKIGHATIQCESADSHCVGENCD